MPTYSIKLVSVARSGDGAQLSLGCEQRTNVGDLVPLRSFVVTVPTAATVAEARDLVTAAVAAWQAGVNAEAAKDAAAAPKIAALIGQSYSATV